jgi:hypothetical protein
MVLVICLGACLVWAMAEIESWRQRKRWGRPIADGGMQVRDDGHG